VKKLLILLAVTSIALAGFSSIAGATLTFALGTGNVAIAGYPAPYGFASVTRLTSTQAQIAFDYNAVGPYTYLFGDGGMVAVNVNATSFAFSGFNEINIFPGFVAGPLGNPPPGPGVEDGFGSFNLTVNNHDGFANTATHVEFLVTNFSGTWGTDSDVLTGNEQGHHVAAHIYVTATPPSVTNGAVATGFATEGGGTVPEPTSMLLLGLGLAGAGAMRRRRKN